MCRYPALRLVAGLPLDPDDAYERSWGYDQWM